MLPLPVYILAGGKSSRFGSDKARALYQGEPLLARIVNTLRPCAANFSVVADTPGKYADLGLRTMGDEVPGRGPLSGLQTALKDLPEPGWLLLLSCDFVSLDCAWIETLAAACADELRAIAFRGEHIEPLCALYHSALLEEVQRALNGNALSLSKLIESVPHNLLPLPANWTALTHINTREELTRRLNGLRTNIRC